MPEEDPTESILNEYDATVGRYEAFTAKVERLVREMLHEAGVEAHTVTSRVKSRESLSDKLVRPGREYSKLADVTDVAGVRITTYFADDVDRVAERMGQWFDIDSNNSVDRRETLDPDRFGYLSLHHVVGFGTERETLPEYGQYGGLKAEVQTRSILQHAWAEIEHDLGYKTREEVPREVRRRFSALAGMLEIADREFESLRNELKEYERDVQERIEKEPQLVEINKASLFAFVQENRTVARIDGKIASAHSLGIAPSTRKDKPYAGAGDEGIEMRVAALKFVEVATIQDLENELERCESKILAFTDEWIKPKRAKGLAGTLIPGTSVLQLAYLLTAKTRNVDKVEKFLKVIGMFYSDRLNRETEARRIVQIYGSISSDGL